MSRPVASAGARAGLDRDAAIAAAVACREDVLRTLRRKYARFPLADIEDCFSSALESLLTQADSYFSERFASAGVVKAWLIRAAGNDLLNADAKWSRRVVSVDPTESLTLIDLVAGNDIPGVVFPDDERNKANQYARLIPEADREIAHLAFFDRLKTAEIAEALGMEALAVQRTIDRARKTVRRRLGEEITESTLCELVAPDLAVLRDTGEFTPGLREHLRSCRACELAVAEASGRAIHAVLPPAAGGGLLAWLLRHTIDRGTRAAAVHAPANSAAAAATTAGTTAAGAAATPVLASAGAFKAGVAVAAAAVALAGGAQVVRAISHHHPQRAATRRATAHTHRRVVAPIVPSAPKPKPTTTVRREPKRPAKRSVQKKSKSVGRHRVATTPARKAPVTRTTSATSPPSAGTKRRSVASASATTAPTGTGLSPTGPVSRVRP